MGTIYQPGVKPLDNNEASISAEGAQYLLKLVFQTILILFNLANIK